MTLYIKKAHLFFFDLHLWDQPLADSARLRPSFRFLANPEEYQKAFSQPRSEGEHLAFRPMLRELSDNGHSFWKSYRAAVAEVQQIPPTEISYWQGLVPFFCRPGNFDLSFSDGTVSAKVSTSVLLWPFGWSTHLGITLPFAEALPLSCIWRFGEVIRKGFSFHHGEDSWNLNKVFIEAGDRIKKEILLGGLATKVPAIVSRYGVTALTPKGAIPPYFPSSPWYETLGVLPDADRARLHSVLVGRKLRVEETLPGPGILPSWVPLNAQEDAYALVNFDDGCLLLLPDSSSPGQRKKTQVRCTASAASTLLLVLFALNGLILMADGKNGDGSVKTLQESALKILKHLPAHTTNPLFLSAYKWFQPRKNRYLSKLCAPSSSSATQEGLAPSMEHPDRS